VRFLNYTVCQKNETRIILNILYCRKSIAMKFSTWYPDDLSYAYILLHSCIYNLPPCLSYVSTLPDITQKPKIYVIFLSIVWVVLKMTDLACTWLWKEPVVWIDHSRCSKWHPFAITHAHSHACHWSMSLSMMPWGILSKVSMLHLINVAFSLCVMSGSVET